MNMNVNNLIKALDNETNDSIMSLTSRKILETNLEILNELQLGKELTKEYLKKLKGYRYVEEISDIKHGGYIRWIPITDPTYLPLHNSCIICDIKITDNGVLITCKNFMHRHYTFKMEEAIIFQKLTNQEQIIINALDHLEKAT
jgi:hypothetical protein